MKLQDWNYLMFEINEEKEPHRLQTVSQNFISGFSIT
jgi:hypothetical protein